MISFRLQISSSKKQIFVVQHISLVHLEPFNQHWHQFSWYFFPVNSSSSDLKMNLPPDSDLDMGYQAPATNPKQKTPFTTTTTRPLPIPIVKPLPPATASNEYGSNFKEVAALLKQVLHRSPTGSNKGVQKTTKEIQQVCVLFMYTHFTIFLQ